MGWFDEQLRLRQARDADTFSDAFDSLAGVVMGDKIARILNDNRIQTKNAIDEILKYYHVKAQELPDGVSDINDQLDYLLRPSGIMRRVVALKGAWYKDAMGAMLGTRADNGLPVALLPAGPWGNYGFLDAQSGKRVKLTKKTAKLIAPDAVCFYRPLPLKKLGTRDLLTFVIKSLDVSDFIMTGAATLAVTLVGLIIPTLNSLIYMNVLGGGLRPLMAVFAFLFGVTLSKTMLEGVSELLVSRVEAKLDMAVEAAGMMRLISLPAAFFKNEASGELSSRMGHLNTLCGMMVNVLFTAGLTSVFSLAYVSQMVRYGPGLVVPGLAVILLTAAVSAVTLAARARLSGKQMEAEAHENGVAYALISGVQKIRLSGAERRAFARWVKSYRPAAKLQYDPPTLIKLDGVFASSLALVGAVVIYYFTVRTGVKLADYYAFNSAYGMVTGAFGALLGAAGTLSQIRPVLDMARPLLETAPETSENKRVVMRLSGGVELNNVSFRYVPDGPLILDNLSLQIRPGQYVAIVGATGCGKSTLMRLLLGFETPQKGAVYYDGKDITTLDLKSLRRHIGTVMQNGKLFQGDIFSNITISAPWLTLDDAWEAAETAGIAEDIRDMPMGMYTVISEGGGGISGGQRQRLLIARAIAPKPKILMFDEATSALDNLTQKKVSDALDGLKCTRVVIAHRLSTIRQCDRILVLDKGRIIEDGSYEELLQKDGCFAELVARQRLDDTAYVGKSTLF